MKNTDLKTVTLTKLCKLHGISMPKECSLTEQFQKAFPSAIYDDEAQEWRMTWEKGAYAESNAQLETFFTENGVALSHVDKC